MFIFSLILPITVGLQYTVSDPEGFYYRNPLSATQSNIAGQTTTWSNLVDCTRDVSISYCSTILPLGGQTSLLEVSDFGFPLYGDEYNITGISAFIVYDATNTDMTYQFENVGITTNNGAGPNYITTEPFIPVSICCQGLYLGNASSTLGMDLKGSDLANIKMQLSVKWLSGSTNRYPQIRVFGLKIYYDVFVQLLSISPTTLIKSPDLPTITVTGLGLSPIPGKALRCRVGGISAQCVAMTSQILFMLLPNVTFGIHLVEVSVDGGIQWTTDPIFITYQASQCSGDYLVGVTCDGSGNAIPDGKVVVPGTNQHNIRNIIVEDGTGFVAPTADLALAGSLTLQLKDKPCNTLSVAPLSARNLVGTFDTIDVVVPNLLACEQTSSQNTQTQTGLSVLISVDSSNCPPLISANDTSASNRDTIIIVGSVVGSVVVGIAIAFVIVIVIYLRTKKETTTSRQTIAASDVNDLERELNRAKSSQNVKINRNTK